MSEPTESIPSDDITGQGFLREDPAPVPPQDEAARPEDDAARGAAEAPAGGERPSDKVEDTFPDTPFVPGSVTEDDVREAMRDVVDPELMVNVVDLGLLYDVRIDDEGVAVLDMTLTSPTCPLTDRIEYDTHMALAGLVRAAVINWVWIPAWNLSMITDEGREQLRAVGFGI